MNREAEILVCFALEEEARPFRRIAAGLPGVQILITGIGRKHAEKSVREFLECNSPQLALSCGFAGGLNPEWDMGAVLFDTAESWLRERLVAAAAKPARFHCAERIATTVVAKAQLRKSTGADAVEMESEAIHALCRERGLACATVRVILDVAGEDLPLDFNQFARPDWSLDYGKLVWAVAKSPGKVAALLKLMKQSKVAAEALAQVLARILAA